MGLVDIAWQVVGRELPTRRPTDVPNRLLGAVQMAPIPVAHRLPPQGYDELESFSYAISSICPISADGEQQPERPRAY
jgi:hypothetical protein